MSPPPAEPLPPRAAIKHHLLVMIVAVVILHAVAISVFYLTHLNQNPGNAQNTYIGVWTFLSAVIVAVQLRKIRRARIEAIRQGAGPSGRRE